MTKKTCCLEITQINETDYAFAYCGGLSNAFVDFNKDQCLFGLIKAKHGVKQFYYTFTFLVFQVIYCDKTVYHSNHSMKV